MTDKKLTDKEIKKALEYCSNPNNTCDKCILFNAKDDSCQCASNLRLQALDYINRLEAEHENWQSAYMTEKQEIANLEIEFKAMRGAANGFKAENERLRELLEEWKSEAYKVADEKDELYCNAIDRVRTAKAEARKEFAKLLIDKSKNGVIHISDIPDYVKEISGGR